MPRYNPDRILRLISELRKGTARLKKLRELNKKEFINNDDKIGSTKYNFIMAIETAIDISNHIISQNGFRAPEDYADSFTVLGEQKIFKESFVKVLRDMAKFRNRLVHLYWEVDDNQVYEILQNSLDDFDKFLNGIAKYLHLDKLNFP